MNENTVCDVNVCDRISPDGGVCEKCTVATFNSGVNLECIKCEEFLCDNCGERPIIGYMGGDASAFLCCEVCWDEVENLHPSARDYQFHLVEGHTCASCR